MTATLIVYACCFTDRQDPHASAVALLDRLQSTYPDRFERAHLRTLQRRVQQWRGIMASKPVYPVSSEIA